MPQCVAITCVSLLLLTIAGECSHSYVQWRPVTRAGTGGAPKRTRNVGAASPQWRASVTDAGSTLKWRWPEIWSKQAHGAEMWPSNYVEMRQFTLRSIWLFRWVLLGYEHSHAGQHVGLDDPSPWWSVLFICHRRLLFYQFSLVDGNPIVCDPHLKKCLICLSAYTRECVYHAYLSHI